MSQITDELDKKDLIKVDLDNPNKSTTVETESGKGAWMTVSGCFSVAISEGASGTANDIKMEEMIKEKDEKILELKKELSKTKEENCILKKHLEDEKDEKDKLNKKLAKKEDKIDKLKKDNKEKDNQIDKLTKQMNEDICKLKKQIEEKDNEIFNLKKQMEEKEIKIRELEKQLTEANKNWNSLMEKNTQDMSRLGLTEDPVVMHINKDDPSKTSGRCQHGKLPFQFEWKGQIMSDNLKVELYVYGGFNECHFNQGGITGSIEVKINDNEIKSEQFGIHEPIKGPYDVFPFYFPKSQEETDYKIECSIKLD